MFPHSALACIVSVLLFAGAASERICRLPVVRTVCTVTPFTLQKHTNKRCAHTHNPANERGSMKNHICNLEQEVSITFHRCLIIEAFRKGVRSQLCYSMRKVCVLRAQGAGLLQISVLVLLHPMW